MGSINIRDVYKGSTGFCTTFYRSEELQFVPSFLRVILMNWILNFICNHREDGMTSPFSC